MGHALCLYSHADGPATNLAVLGYLRSNHTPGTEVLERQQSDGQCSGASLRSIWLQLIQHESTFLMIRPFSNDIKYLTTNIFDMRGILIPTTTNVTNTTKLAAAYETY